MSRLLGLIFLASLPPLFAQQRCKGLIPACRDAHMGDLNWDGRYWRAELFGSETTEIYYTFFRGLKYRLIPCGRSSTQATPHLRIYNANRVLLLDTRTQGEKPFWGPGAEQYPASDYRGVLPQWTWVRGAADWARPQRNSSGAGLKGYLCRVIAWWIAIPLLGIPLVALWPNRMLWRILALLQLGVGLWMVSAYQVRAPLEVTYNLATLFFSALVGLPYAAGLE